jgi:hypothetical protein
MLVLLGPGSDAMFCAGCLLLVMVLVDVLLQLSH